MVIFNLSPVLEQHDKLYNCKCRSHLWVQETSGNLFLLIARLQRIPDRREILDHPTAHKDTFEFIFKNIFFSSVKAIYTTMSNIKRKCNHMQRTVSKEQYIWA